MPRLAIYKQLIIPTATPYDKVHDNIPVSDLCILCMVPWGRTCEANIIRNIVVWASYAPITTLLLW